VREAERSLDPSSNLVAKKGKMEQLYDIWKASLDLE